MINAERILQTLDNWLDHEVSLVVYGRAAIALGFANPPAPVTKSLDVDAVIPLSQVGRFQADQNFWDAQEATNRELEKEGLYITHLFAADQVFLAAIGSSICSRLLVRRRARCAFFAQRRWT